MKEFNLEEAKAGKPVQTRDGRKARILAYDTKNDFPIVAAIQDLNLGKEQLRAYTLKGEYWEGHLDDLDLVMAAEQVWFNVYKCQDGEYGIGINYPSEKEAKESRSPDSYLIYIKTISVEV